MKNGKFKVGDKVRYVNDSIGSFYEREPLVMKKVYTVSGFFNNSSDVLLKEITNKSGYGYCQSRFELVVEDNKTMKTSFKVGDKVRCINDNTCSSLEIGKVYTLVKVGPEFVHIDDTGGYFPSRFELVAEDKPKENKMNVLVIKVDNEILSECIQKLLFKAGFSWGAKGAEKDIQMTGFPYIYAHFKSTYGENRIYIGSNFYKDPGYELFDAAKDFAKINEILSARAKPTMAAPKVNGYVMEYKKGDLIATFGCAKISTSFIRDVSRMMAEDYKGNRKLDKIVLDSGVTLSKDDVSNIVKYVDFVNKNG